MASNNAEKAQRVILLLSGGRGERIGGDVPKQYFDILSCGGFVLSNYQTELPELFTPGEDLAVYGSMEELLFLAEYYLTHDEQRREIAACGYETLKKNYTCEVQMGKMMLAAFEK